VTGVEIGVIAQVRHTGLCERSPLWPLKRVFQYLAKLRINATTVGRRSLLQSQRKTFIDVAHNEFRHHDDLVE
jgi:hypothetical protein